MFALFLSKKTKKNKAWALFKIYAPYSRNTKCDYLQTQPITLLN